MAKTFRTPQRKYGFSQNFCVTEKRRWRSFRDEADIPRRAAGDAKPAPFPKVLLQISKSEIPFYAADQNEFHEYEMTRL